VSRLGEVALRRFTGGDAAGQTATLVATAAIGSSFARGLMPRRSIDQAIATGVVGATQYGLVVTSQSVSAELARALVGRRAGWVGPYRSLRVDLPELQAMRAVSCGASPMLRVRFACGGVGRRGPPLRALFAVL
jgi:hypothetical protein